MRISDWSSDVCSSDLFVDDVVIVDVVRVLGARMVDMESYAYAWVAAQFGVPIRILKAVSDRAQDGATELWATAVFDCSRVLRDHIRALYGLCSPPPRVRGSPLRRRAARSPTPAMSPSPWYTPTVILPFSSPFSSPSTSFSLPLSP